MHVSISGRCAFSRSSVELFGFLKSAYLGTVMWCERFKCNNSKELQFGDKERGSKSGENPNVESIMFCSCC
jgi:hypothetical protein